MSNARWLRRQAVGWSLPRTGGRLADTLTAMEFVQADPIRSPARAQDLILRQRVRGYRAGDLERHYPALDVDEDWLYAYGFVAGALRPYLQPRPDRHAADGVFAPRGRTAEVLAFVRERGVAHPREVQQHFGAERVTNAWGGASQATTVDLERLRHFGYLRVADRVSGVRRYAAVPPPQAAVDPERRRRVLVRRVARTLAPVTEDTLAMAVAPLLKWCRPAGSRPDVRPVIRALVREGVLAAVEVGGTRYVWPADLAPVEAEPAARVRFLAPFDPVVWDRRRFGEVWGWDYRFEAYTPPAARRLGYYAMPLLWRDRVIGWATCAGAGADVEVGYVDRPPAGAGYARALDAEIDRLKGFLTQA